MIRFEIAEDHPLRDVHARIDEHLRLIDVSRYYFTSEVRGAIQPLTHRSQDDPSAYLRAAVERLRYGVTAEPRDTKSYDRLQSDMVALRALVQLLVLKKIDWRAEDLAFCVTHTSVPECWDAMFDFKPIINAVEKSGLPIEGELALAIEERAERMGTDAYGGPPSKPARMGIHRLHKILGDDRVPTGDLMRARIAEATPKKEWDALARYALTAKAARPSQRWLKKAGTHIEAVGGFDAFARMVEPWFLDFPTHQVREGRDGTSELYKGLVWCTALDETGVLAEPLGDLADKVLTKIPGHGALDTLVGNACLWAFGAMPGMSGIAHLARLKRRAKWPSMQERIEKALLAAAERLGLSLADLEELGVPTLGLGPGGELHREIGAHTARLRIDGTKTVALTWLKDGKERKSVPTDVKRDHAAELKEVRATAKQLRALLPVQRDRLDQLFWVERSWPLATWRERYLDHPVVGPLARRLIWTLDGRAALPVDDGFVDADDAPVAGETVAIWHPIDATADEVRAWRDALERREITQPFKQAHREIYVLTDAERRTRTYSNRFAQHILRQHQMRALCEQRGWRYTLVGDFDSFCYPDKLLPGGYTVDFVTDAPQDFPVSDSGIYLAVVTDRVAFARRRRPVPLEEVPPRLFSETMRDVDLFVGVASIGTDPTWRDRGEEHRTYWDGYAWGELNAAAQTRRDVLANLIPKLKIADRCTLGDRFLTVRGDRGTYKIHLGSANILMEPNDEYLCIVQNRTKGAGVFLPFEGDETLAVILSKAFLLAADRKITDPEILSQLRP